MRKIVTLVLILIAFLNARGANRYVSAVGNDANVGSIASPYRTIAKVNSIFATLAPGDSILFRRGDTFNGTLIISRSGTALLPIIIGAYGTGNKPIFSALTSMTGWTQSPTNVWTSSANGLLGSVVRIVLDDNVLLPIGRYPNLTAPNAGYLTFETSTTTSITDNQLLNTPNWAGASMAVRINTYLMDVRVISTHVGTRLNTTTAFQNAPIPTAGYFFQNSLATLDQQGEFFYNPTTKRLAVYSTSIPTGVQASYINTLIRTSTFSYITFDNISLIGANDTCTSIGPNNGTGGTGIVVQNCKIEFTGGNSVQANNTAGLIIKSDSILTSLNNGMRINNSPSAIIRKNYVINTQQIAGMGGSGLSGVGINMTVGTGTLIDTNTVINSGFDGIKLDGNNVIVKNNYVNTYCNRKNDGGGIAYVPPGGLLATGIQILNNVILNGIGAIEGSRFGSAIMAHAIYLDNNASNVLAKGNSGAYGDAGIFLHRGHNNNVRENTMYGFVKQFWMVNDDASGEPITGISVKRNIFVARSLQRVLITSTSASTFGSFDSNYYARPILDNLTLRNIATDISLAMWRTAYPAFDIHTNKSPRTITNDNQLFWFANPTTSVISTTLVGSWVDMANTSYSGLISLQPFTSLVLISTGALITPTITWNNPAAITYPTPLSATQLNATSGGVPGTFAYTPASGTILNAGVGQTLSVTFTPTNTVVYSTVSKSVLITVNKAAATMTYSNLTQTYTGLPLAPTITTNPSGLTIISTLYNGVGATPTNAGVYSIVSSLTNTNYTAPNISGTFTINKASATLNVSNLAQTYNGSPKPITVVTSPVGLSGVTVLYNGSATAPTNAGTYTVDVSLSNTNYSATPVSTTLVIAKATPTVSWSTPSAITYGTALSGTQLNATASVAGTFLYTPASGAILNAGTQTLSVNFTPTDGTNYNSVNNTTVNLTVNKAVATLALSNTTQTYDGSGHAVTVTSNPVGLAIISVTYNGSATLPINAGTYAVSATLNNSNYTATPATGNLVIDKAVATIVLSGLTQAYNSSQRVVTATTVPAGLSTVSITYNGSATAPTNAGTYSIVASLSNTNYQATNATGTLTITKVTPTVNWSNPTAITYGTALSGTQLNATASVAGSFTYLPASGTILNAGTYTLIVNFVPTDGTNYNTVNGTSVSITVNKATATLSLSGLAQDYDGNPKPVTVTTTPAGLDDITITYNGSATAPTAVGTYAIIASLSNTNYTATNATGNLVISMSAATVTITDLIQTYTGSPLPVTVTVVGGWPTSVTYNASATVPTNVGTYTVIATISDGIHSGADTATYNIIKANPVITWGNPSAITYGTALSGTELNASSSVAGSFIYLPASGVILNAGTQTLSTSFTPTDAANYNSVPVTTVNITVNKAVATITLGNLTQVYDGTQKSASVTTSPAGLTVISITYDGSPTAPSAVGSYTVAATLTNSNYTATPAGGTLQITTASAGISISNIDQTYTGSALPVTVSTNPNGLTYTVTYNASATVPTNAGSYTVIATLTGGIYTGADTQTLVISKATPIITWANPSDISFPTALSGTQLNATANVAGSFVYSPISGSVLNVGANQNLSVTFTPTDASNYNVVNKIVTINVTSAGATLTLSSGSLSQVYDGLPKSVVVTTSPANLTGITVTYNGSLTPPTNAGNYTIIVSLVNSNYTASNIGGTLVISKAAPILTWAYPQPIMYSTALSSLQLNATSSIAGTFVYTPAVGSILQVGTQRISTIFTPTDAVNYSITTISVPISVYGNPILDFYIRNGDIIYIEIP